MKKKEKKTYSLFSNVMFIMKAHFKQNKGMKFLFPARMIAALLKIFLPILLSATAVSVIEKGEGAEIFFLKTGGLLLAYIAVMALDEVTAALYSNCAVNTRVFGFTLDLIWKNITTDYCNREAYDKQKLFGKAGNALNSNWIGVERVIRETPSVIQNFLGMILFGGAILAVDIRILLVLLLMLVCNILTNRYARNYLNKHREEDSELGRKFWYLKGCCEDMKCGKDARIYRMESWFGKLMETYVEQGQKWQRGVEAHYYLPVAGDTIFIALRDGLAYVILIQKAIQGDITLAGLTMMLGVVSNFATWMFSFVNSCEGLADANEMVSDYRRAIDLKDSFLHEGGVTTENMRTEPVEIELKNVSFAYTTEEGEDNQVLKNLNFRIRKGEKVAFVGNNGAGKTTLVKLLCGFYHPTEGEILVNGISIEKYNIEEYFKLLGVVFQDVQLLDFTILSQISGKAKEETDMDRFWDAVEKAGLRQKIESLDKKEDTYINRIFDDEGIELSGGESQKLMLARCIYKDAPFLILDEPTAALDPIAESEMYQEYERMTENKTSIFISHRLASTKFCDHILFLENGEIAEEGTHQELLEKGGRYAKIFEIQSHYYKTDAEEEEMEAAYE